ncbi:MAG: hypothetical protein H6735_13170 [Alphaproteobacteria bacterium]|nr:hypothetical protein [Alphaproteobacteria bacterium]
MPGCRHVTGTVLARGTSTPQERLTVRVLGEGRSSTVLASARTDHQGRFSFDLGATPTDATLRLEVLDDGRLLPTTGDVSWPAAQDAHGLVVCVERAKPCGIPVDRPPASLDNCDQGVHGRVRHDDGTPIEGVEVVLCAVDFHGKRELTDATRTVEDGWFCLGRIEPKQPTDLVLEVYLPTRSERPRELLAVSDLVVGHAGGPLRIDVSVCHDRFRAPSEFARISLALSRAIFAGRPEHPHPRLDDALATSSRTQLDWLARHTDWDATLVEQRAGAAWLSDATGGLATQPLYGLLRQGFPRSVDALLGRPPTAVRNALGIARRTNVIGLDGDPAAFVEQLVGARAALLNGDTDDALGSLLSTSYHLEQPQGLTPKKVAVICEVAAERRGTEAFWTTLSATPHLTERDLDEARRLIQLGTVALGHAPTVSAFLTEGLGTAPADTLATWDRGRFEATAKHVSPLPDGLDGDTERQRRRSLARILEEQVALAWPGPALTTALTGSAGEALGVASILARPANAGLDLRHARIHVDAPGLALDPSRADQEVEALRTAQRLARIAPELGAADAMARLAGLGIGSARSVVRTGRNRFVDAYAGNDEVLRDEALAIHARAASQSALATQFYLQAHPALGQARLGFVATTPVRPTEAQVPGWAALFETPSGTRCEWCQSIHGPSAYLVDLLDWLRNRTSRGGTFPNALAALLDRRPDLANLPLTCENAERVLPLIDLSLEVLEAVVDPTSGLGDAHSSEARTPEMLAAPQYTNEAAYDAIARATTSFHTPFHRSLREARRFLEHLGVSRAELMRLFGTPTPAEVAAEDLGLSVERAAAITDRTTSEQAWWGNPLSDPHSVRTWTRCTGSDHEALLDLLHTRSVNAVDAASPDSRLGHVVTVQLASADPYDVSSHLLRQVSGEAALGEPNAWSHVHVGAWTRLRQTLRLWNATPWSARDLDRVLASLGALDPSTWTDATLVAVADVVRLQRATERSPTELAAWFGPLDTRADRDRDDPSPSHFDQTFADPSLFPAAEQARADFPFALTADRTELARTPPLADHTARVAAVLSLDTAELEALVSALGRATTDPLTLELLSLLWRWTSLAGVLELDPTDALRVAALLGEAPAGTDPGLFRTPADTWSFLDRARALLAAGWTVDELDYLAVHRGADVVGPTEDWVRGVLGRLRDTARQQAEDADATTAADALLRQLADELGLDRAVLDDLDPRVHAVAPGTAPATHVAATELLFDPPLPASSPLAFDATTSLGVVTVPAGASLLLGALPADTGLVPSGATFRADAVLDVGAVVVLLAGTAVTGPDGPATLTADETATLVASVALEVPALEPTSATASLVQRFLRPAFLAEGATDEGDPWSDLGEAAFPTDHRVIAVLHQVALLVARLDVDADLYTAWREASWAAPLDPASLFELVPDSADPGLFDALHRTIRALGLRDRLPGSAPSFAELLAAPAAEAFAERTGWDLTTLTTLWPTALDVDAMELLLDQMDVLGRVGAELDTVRG